MVERGELVGHGAAVRLELLADEVGLSPLAFTTANPNRRRSRKVEVGEVTR